MTLNMSFVLAALGLATAHTRVIQVFIPDSNRFLNTTHVEIYCFFFGSGYHS